MGKKFLLNTDNMILKYFFDQPDLNAKKAIWFSFLSKYHFELKHIKEKENKIVDALSRRAHMLYEVTLSQTDSDLHDRITMVRKVDRFNVKALKNIQEDMLFQQQNEYKVDDIGLNYGPKRDYMFRREETYGPLF